MDKLLSKNPDLNKNLKQDLIKVGVPGLEPGTSSLSEMRSDRLSYTPLALNILTKKTCLSKYFLIAILCSCPVGLNLGLQDQHPLVEIRYLISQPVSTPRIFSEEKI